MAAAQEEIIPRVGDLASIAPSRVLRSLEQSLFTGELRFTLGSKTRVIPVLAGEPQLDHKDAEAALEALLAANSGPYELREKMGELEGATRVDARTIKGELGAFAVADVLRYCETTALTGKAEIKSDGRECVARYSKGELVSLTLDGNDDADLEALFAWTSGAFTVHQRSLFDEEEPSRVSDLRQPLSTIELALSDILARSLLGAMKTQKKEVPEPDVTKPARPRTNPSNRPVADQSVKIFFRPPKLDPSSTLHAKAGGHAEVVTLSGASSDAMDSLTEESAEEVIRVSREETPKPMPSVEASSDDDGAKKKLDTPSVVMRRENASLALTIVFATVLVGSALAMSVSLLSLLRSV